jgi:oxygen-independent coproporphyrinogen-3 oxidase
MAVVFMDSFSASFMMQPLLTTEMYHSFSSNLRQNADAFSDVHLLDSPRTTGSHQDHHHPIGLYIHIPYCRQRCRYCDFAIVPIGNATTTRTESEKDSGTRAPRQSLGFRRMNDRYMDALLTELAMLRPQSSSRRDTIPLQSIYFGGGTPSLAPVESIRDILYHACVAKDAPFAISQDTEITLEMDPGTFDRAKLQALKDAGINRISLGVQSLDDAILQGMGRVHRHHDIARAVEDIAAVFDGDGSSINYSMDLISGAPGLTLAKWADTLQQVSSGNGIFAATGPPQHVSIYDLQIEAGTVFQKWYGRNQDDDSRSSSTVVPASNNTFLRLPTEEDCAFMYKYASGYLRAKGYEHYEVSSYAKRSCEGRIIDKKVPSPWRSRHNQIYWDYSSSWYALGLGATSFVNRTLVARPRKMDDYIQWVKAGQQEGGDSQTNMMESDFSDNGNDKFLPDLLLKRLRTCDGLDLKWLDRHYGSQVVQGVLDGAQLGLELGLAERTKCDILRLKDPDG